MVARQPRPPLVASAIGFFGVTLVPVTIDHLLERLLWAEVADALLTTAVFTAFFAVGQLFGGRLARPNQAPSATPLELTSGATAALIHQGSIWGFWLIVTEPVRRGLAGLAFPVHLLLALVLGTLVAGWRARTVATG